MLGARGTAGLIDLHSHILPALDDGALDIADALGMARQAAADGVRTVCATPHIRHDHDVVIAELETRVAALNAELRARNIDVEVLTGGEVAETALSGLRDDELAAASLGGGGRWILLEPAPGPLGHSLVSAVDELERRGFRSVIAHPERHADELLPQRLATLVEAGALVQITAAMLEHEHAAPVIGRLAADGLVHLLGSDSHSSRGGRPLRLSGGFAALREAPDVAAHVDWMATDAPRAILAGEDVEPPFPVSV
jgi:protein-tyrosine phosphatase